MTVIFQKRRQSVASNILQVRQKKSEPVEVR